MMKITIEEIKKNRFFTIVNETDHSLMVGLEAIAFNDDGRQIRMKMCVTMEKIGDEVLLDNKSPIDLPPTYTGGKIDVVKEVKGRLRMGAIKTPEAPKAPTIEEELGALALKFRENNKGVEDLELIVQFLGLAGKAAHKVYGEERKQ
jgi:hypothetical protein